MKAARAWAIGRGGATRRSPDAMSQTANVPEWLQKRLSDNSDAPGEVQVPPDEQATLALFLSLGTQWRWCPVTGRRVGLDYAAITPTASLQGTEITPMVFHDLRQMETAALGAIAERRAR